jgi:hypothetical protein
MPSSTLRHGSFDWGWRLAALWGGVAAGPLAWAIQLEANYALSYVACEQRHTWMLHLVTIAALLIVAAGAFAAWSARPPLTVAGPSSAGEDRSRFMAVGGLAMCAWFTLVILATEIPAVVVHPCIP